jgi:hypothetical protein
VAAATPQSSDFGPADVTVTWLARSAPLCAGSPETRKQQSPPLKWPEATHALIGRLAI